MNNLFNSDDEASGFEADFMSAAANPDQKFLDSLLNKIKMEDTQPAKPRSILGLQPVHFYALASLCAVAVISTGLIIGINEFNNQQALQKESQTALLKEILSKNTKGLNNLNAYTATARTANGASDTSATGMASRELMPLIYTPENTFTHNKVVTSFGPAINVLSQCDTYITPEGTSESYYHQGKNNPISHNLQYDKNGGLISETLSTDRYTQEYQGGSFALKTLEDRNYSIFSSDLRTFAAAATSTAGSRESTVLTQSEPDKVVSSTVSDDVTSAFGPDVKILGEEKLDGRDYHVITWSYDRYCIGGNSFKNVVKSWIDKDTKLAYKNEYYLREISPASLEQTEVITMESAVRPYAEVEAEFAFKATTAIKELDMNAVNAKMKQQYVDAILKLINTQGMGFVTPSDYVELAYVNSSSVNMDYNLATRERIKYYTRDFWPNTPEGQTRYDNYKKMYEPGTQGATETGKAISPEYRSLTPVLLGLTFNLKGETFRSLMVNAFAQVADVGKLLTEQYGVSDQSNKKEYELELNFKKVKVTEYTQNLYYRGESEIKTLGKREVDTKPLIDPGTGNSSSGSSGSVPMPQTCPQDTDCEGMVLRVFTVDNFTYVVQQQATVRNMVANLEPLIMASKNSAVYNRLLTEITAAVKK